MTTLSESKSFYEKYYLKKKETGRTYSAILKHFKEPALLLDVACGDGQFLTWLPEYIRPYGVDISQNAILIAQKNLKNHPKSFLAVAAVEALPFRDKQFDYVTCFGSIEHFVDKDRGLAEMKRVGQERCKYLFVVPNSNFNIVSLTKGKVGTEQAENIEELHTQKEWREIFNKAGFEIQSIEKFPVYRKSWAWLKWLIYWLLPLRFDEQFLFILKKA